MTHRQPDLPEPSAAAGTDRSTAELFVYTLGPPRVEHARQPLTISRRQTRALLYRLAARLEPVGREQLAFLFWPDKPDATARRNLSQLLSLLRHALPHRDWLLTSRSHVRLDREFVWSDAAAFEALCDGRDAPRRTEKLEQAVSLYRGPFLSGVALLGSPEYEAWVSQTRYALEHLYLEALKTLTEAEAAQGAYQAATAHARQYLAVDELAEDVHRRLIELYAAAGDRDARADNRSNAVAVPQLSSDGHPQPGYSVAVAEIWLAG